MIRPMLPAIGLCTCLTALSYADLDQDIRARFAIASAHPILHLEPLGPDTRQVAERMVRYVRDGCDRAFVAEDAKAVAIQVGTVDKLGVDPPGLLTAWDKYRMLVTDKGRVAYNVSQETYIGRNLWESSVPLMPLMLLDRYRTLCANGVPSIWELSRMPQRSLLLAIVDDRQRGPHPNQTRRIMMRDEIGNISVVGVRADWYLLEVQMKGRPSYLEVHGRTLETRRPDSKTVRAAQACRAERRTELNQIRRLHPEYDFVPLSRARWMGRTYFIAYFQPKMAPRPPAAYVWDGERLTPTDPWAIVATSINGRYGWLLNRDTGQSWLISH